MGKGGGREGKKGGRGGEGERRKDAVAKRSKQLLSSANRYGGCAPVRGLLVNAFESTFVCMCVEG